MTSAIFIGFCERHNIIFSATLNYRIHCRHLKISVSINVQ